MPTLIQGEVCLIFLSGFVRLCTPTPLGLLMPCRKPDTGLDSCIKTAFNYLIPYLVTLGSWSVCSLDLGGSVWTVWAGGSCPFSVWLVESENLK